MLLRFAHRPWMQSVKPSRSHSTCDASVKPRAGIRDSALGADDVRVRAILRTRLRVAMMATAGRRQRRMPTSRCGRAVSRQSPAPRFHSMAPRCGRNAWCRPAPRHPRHPGTPDRWAGKAARGSRAAGARGRLRRDPEGDGRPHVDERTIRDAQDNLRRAGSLTARVRHAVGRGEPGHALAAGRERARGDDRERRGGDPDGTADCHFAHPGAAPIRGAVWPDALGLRPAFEAMGRRLAESGTRSTSIPTTAPCGPRSCPRAPRSRRATRAKIFP